MIGLEEFEAIGRACWLANARATIPLVPSFQFQGRRMHAAPAPARTASGSPVKFGKKLLRLETLGQRMSVAAVRAEDHVRFLS